MAMARVVSENRKQLLRPHILCRRLSKQPRTSKTKGEGAKMQKTDVPTVAARCKTIVGINWRGQLTTLNPNLVDEEERKKAEKTYGELSSYIVYEKKLIVHVPEESQHCPNLLLNNRASLIIGHTDPSPLMRVFQQVQKRPPHTLLVGMLTVPDDTDHFNSKTMEAVIKKELSELKQIVNQSIHSLRVILESGSHILRSHVQALNRMLDAKNDDMFCQFDVNSCHFIDMSGIKHSVEWELPGKMDKCLSPLLQVMIEGINRNHKRRMGLKVLCAWFLHLKVEEAFALSADRCGMNVLAKVFSGAKLPMSDVRGKPNSGEENLPALKWKELRLNFRDEIRGINDFFMMLNRMERECVVEMGPFKEETPSLSSEEELVEE